MKSYWAASTSADEVLSELWKRIESYFAWRKKTGHLDRANRSISTYYGFAPDGGGTTSHLTPGGDGELVKMNTNHFAGLATQTMSLVVGERPTFKAIAVGNGYSDKAQAMTAEGILEHYDRNLFLHRLDKSVAIRTILTGEGYGALHWNFGVGEEVADADGNVARDGDVDISVHSLLDIAFDQGAKDFEKSSWVCIRRRVNRWELAQLYPAKYEEICGHSSDDIETMSAEVEEILKSDELGDDYIWLWEFRHPPSPALPSGRLMRFLSGNVLVYDTHTDAEGNSKPGAYPYGSRTMVRQMAADEVIGSAAGHTAFFDLLAQQEGIDLVATIMASTVNLAGASNLYVARGSNIQIDSIGGGFNVIQGDGVDAPKAIETAKVSKEALDFAQMCIQWMRQRTAINDVVMGEPSKGMPAQAMALLHAQAIQFHSTLQDSFQRYMEGIRTDLIDMLKAFADNKRTALVAGAANTWQLKEFERKDIEGVNRVYVERIPASAKTFAGKISMAKDMLDMGMVQEPQQYVDLVATGQFKPIIEAPQANLMRIQAEMDLLRQGIGLPPIDVQASQLAGSEVFADDGKPHVLPLISDTHWLDIPQFLSVINTPQARANQAVVKAVTEVVSYKMKLWRQMDPALIVAMKGIPAPPLMDPANLGPAPTEQMGEPANGGGKPQESADLGGLNEKVEQTGASMPKMPEPPPNPLQ